MFVGQFPAVSETFVLNQITSLMDLGHEVDIFSQAKPESAPVHASVERYGLLSRTTYIEHPDELAYWEMPVYPLTGRTWIPGSGESVLNIVRLGRAIPKLVRAFARSPGLAAEALRTSRYGYQASSLSSVYRLAALAAVPRRYDVVHAHFGPVAANFRFIRRLWRAPFLVTFHGYDFSKWPREQGPAVYHPLFREVDRVTVNSAYAGRRVVELGCSEDKVTILRVGLNVA